MDLVAINKQLTADLATITGERDQARTDLATLTGERDQARTDLAAANTARETAETTLTTVTGERDQTRTDLTAAQERIEALKGQVGALEARTPGDEALAAIAAAGAPAVTKAPNTDANTGKTLLEQYNELSAKDPKKAAEFYATHGYEKIMGGH